MSTYDRADKSQRASIVVRVVDLGRPVHNASISLFKAPAGLDRGKVTAKNWKPKAEDFIRQQQTQGAGDQAVTRFEGLDPNHDYVVRYDNEPETDAQAIDVQPGCDSHVCFDIPLGFELEPKFVDDNYQDIKGVPEEGQRVILTAKYTKLTSTAPQGLSLRPPTQLVPSQNPQEFYGLLRAGRNVFDVSARLSHRSGLVGPTTPISRATDARLTAQSVINGAPRTPQLIDGKLGVSLKRTSTALTADVSHWQAILNITEALSFNRYFDFMEMMFCGRNDVAGLLDFEQDRFAEKKEKAHRLLSRRMLPFIDTDAYRYVKVATEAFVIVNCGIMSRRAPFADDFDSGYFDRRDVPFPTTGLEALLTENYLTPVSANGGDVLTLPYLAVIRKKLADVDVSTKRFKFTDDQVSECYGILQSKLTNPCLLELIWSYWQEEGMLVQTTNAITRRFQNVRGSSGRDPLANLEIDPLRPLSNLLWGWVQDEQHRLSVVRRNYEYDHHYGFRLEGRVVQGMNPADTRSKFIEAFHNLLRLCTFFFKQDDDTTIKADAFPVLNALKEVHLILTEGQHNQFGDLTSTARVEMMMQQWLLARPEFREFLPTRISVAYPEPWMDRVDAMKKLQGWTDTSVLHFRNLAVFGEQILLGVRWGFWSDVQEPEQAFNWARLFRPQIQGYIHAYRAVAGVDLSAETADAQVDATMPSTLLRRRLTAQQQRGA